MVRAALRENVLALEFASEALRADPFMARLAVRGSWAALSHVDCEALEDDREIFFEAASQSGHALVLMPERYCGDGPLVLAALRAGPTAAALDAASEQLLGDRTFVLEAVRTDGLALRFASEELRNDHAVVLEALVQNHKARHFVPDALHQDALFRRVVEGCVRSARAGCGRGAKQVSVHPTRMHRRS